MTTQLIATLTTTDAAKEHVHQAMRLLVPASQSEPGCIRYELFEIDPAGYGPTESTGGSFAVIEEWRDDAALAAHLASDHFQAFATAFSPDEMKVTVQMLQPA